MIKLTDLHGNALLIAPIGIGRVAAVRKEDFGFSHTVINFKYGSDSWLLCVRETPEEVWNLINPPLTDHVAQV